MARFTVYTLKTEHENKQLLERFFIVLKDGDVIRFTDFDKYAWSSVNKKRKINSNNRMRCVYACAFLNFAYFDYVDKNGKRGIGCLNNLNVDVIQEFLNRYGQAKLPGETSDNKRQSNTINRTINYVFDFITNFIDDKKNNNCKLKSSDLYKEKLVRSRKSGKTRTEKVPTFDVETDPAIEEPILRDVPNDVFNILFTLIYKHHRNLFGLVFLSAFAGLRPADAVNVRRTDSILGPGIIFSFRNNKVSKIKIDLSTEYNMRSDIKSSSRTKKEKWRYVPPHCFQPFYESYKAYMEYLDGKTYDEEHGPLNINKQGKAFNVNSYRQQFEKIVREELCPILMESENPELVAYANVLKSKSLGPHAFRHYYTVQLILNGVTNPQDIAFYRGDNSTRSAEIYLSNKSEIEKLYKKVSNEAFDYMTGLADNYFSEND